MQDRLPSLALFLLHDSVESMSMLFTEIMKREFDLSLEQKETLIRFSKVHVSEAFKRLNIVGISCRGLTERHCEVLEQFRCNLDDFQLGLVEAVENSPLNVEIGTKFVEKKAEISNLLMALEKSLEAVIESNDYEVDRGDERVKTISSFRQQGGDNAEK